MLSYTRRGKASSNTKTIKSNPDTAFLGYCNWSYSEQYHINVNESINMFENFNSIYLPYYRRMFNEMPRSVLHSFMKRHNISNIKATKIYQTLIQRTTIKMKDF